MVGSIINTSYKDDVPEYVVVSASRDGVILRPTNPEVLSTYWKEFISGYVHEDVIPTIQLTQLPSEVLKVDAYVDYSIEYPRVIVHFGDIVVDMSDRISCNHPNPETPGLYAIDFMLSVGTGNTSTRIWRSWVSIDEPPLLRNVISPWNRSDRVIADLNRLVMEPQFQESLYQSGVPLYNFQQANAPAAVSSLLVQSFKASRAFVKDGNLFVTGARLPVGAVITVNGIKCTIGTDILAAPYSQTSRYGTGEVVSYGGRDYYAVMDMPLVEDGEDVPGTGNVIPGTSYVRDGVDVYSWVGGTLYSVPQLGLPDGEVHIDSLWSIVDVNGYLFKMDLLRAMPLKHYWGHYDRKYFYDYAPGDIVSVISDNVISLYQRNDTPVDESGLEESYRPGHYMNPHWVEVYSSLNGSALRDPIIIPYTNATNAVISKTCPVREEAFRIYAHLVGMPDELVDALGTKYSVLLWALLYRTRETFPGFRAALRAIGLDAKDLHRETPSVIYTGYGVDGMSSEIRNVYDEINRVKEIAKSVKADKIWYGDGNPDMSDSDLRNSSIETIDIPWIRYSRTGEQPDTVWRFVQSNTDPSGSWIPYYSFRHIGSDSGIAFNDYSVNNRYYRATVNMLDRLASECVVDLGDGEQWIDHNYIGAISTALTALLSYEIPIYVYFRLKLNLAAIGHVVMGGVSSSAVMHEAWGGSIGLKLYPGKYFDFRALQVIEVYPVVLFSYTGGNNYRVSTDYRDCGGWRYYPFNQAVYIKIEYEPLPDGCEVKPEGYWVSQYTIGCLGNDESPGTDDFRHVEGSDSYNGFLDAVQAPVGVPLYLCKGMSAVTLKISSIGNLRGYAECLRWQYVFGDPDQWVLNDTQPFADWVAMGTVYLFTMWTGSPSEFRNAVARVTSSKGVVPFKWETDGSEEVLYIGGDATKYIYLWDRSGYVIAMLQLDYVDNMVRKGSDADYLYRIWISDNS